MDVATHPPPTHLWCMDTCSASEHVTSMSIHHTCVCLVNVGIVAWCCCYVGYYGPKILTIILFYHMLVQPLCYCYCSVVVPNSSNLHRNYTLKHTPYPPSFPRLNGGNVSHRSKSANLHADLNGDPTTILWFPKSYDSQNLWFPKSRNSLWCFCCHIGCPTAPAGPAPHWRRWLWVSIVSNVVPVQRVRWDTLCGNKSTIETFGIWGIIGFRNHRI